MNNKENVVLYIYNSDIKKKEILPCDDMDEHRGHYAKWSKLEEDRPINYDLAYTWNLKKKTSS